MEVKYLKKFEVLYEVKIRNFNAAGTEEVAELRSILRQLIKSKHAISEGKTKLDENNLKEIRTTLTEIETLITQYPGKDAKVSYRRIEARLVHVMGRVARCEVENTDEENVLKGLEESAVSLKARLEIKSKNLIKSMCSTFLGEAQPVPFKAESECESDSTSVSSSDDEWLSILKRNNVKPLTPCGEESIQLARVLVYKWDLRFTGREKPDAIMSFLERVEELRVARNISKSKLYLSAIDLFSGDAIAWFRSVTG